uniref:ATPase family AAA domain-containing protein 1 n=1 Tax=Cacopsylla melanoneura TaxID=428564 RepID=A0A8D8Y8G1_9HEMI
MSGKKQCCDAETEFVIPIPECLFNIILMTLFIMNQLYFSIQYGIDEAIQYCNKPVLDSGPNPLKSNEIIMNAIKIGVVAVSSFYFFRMVINEMDPTKKQKKELKALAMKKLKTLQIKMDSFTDHEMSIASHLVDPDDITVSWQQIAGLDNIIKDLKQTVLFPITHKAMFANSKITKPPKGILLYGPPGCGKTMIAKAAAKEAGMKFINLDISLLTDKWYGESQKLVAATFSIAGKIQPCIIFIDEIDSFLRARSSTDHEATAMMKAQFMSLWDGLATDNECVSIVMGATNRPNDLDPAILRRMPKRYAINLPNVEQRKTILQLYLTNERVSKNINYEELADKTDGFSGSDLQELCRTASFRRINPDFIKKCDEASASSGSKSLELPEISMQDLEITIEETRKTSLGTRPRMQTSNSIANESDA